MLKKGFRFTYTKREFTQVFYRGRISAGITISLLLIVFVGSVAILCYNFTGLVESPVTAIVLICFIFIAYIFFAVMAIKNIIYAKKCLSTEQKVFINDDHFFAESGTHIFSAPISKIKKIKINKYFCLFSFDMARGYEGWNKYLITPRIPLRLLTNSDLMTISDELRRPIKLPRV